MQCKIPIRFSLFLVQKIKVIIFQGKLEQYRLYELSQETDIRSSENIPDHLKDHSL